MEVRGHAHQPWEITVQRHHRLATGASLAALVLSTALVAPSMASDPGHRTHHGHHHATDRLSLRAVTALDGPRGVDALGRGRTLVTESDGSFSLVLERHRRAALVVPLGQVTPGLAPAIAADRSGNVYVLTGAGEPGTGAATLYRWRRGYDEPVPVADIAAYQVTDPDPDDLEGLPAESNPFGLAVLPDGDVLVADAAGNDLLKVDPDDGSILTVARFRPRTVAVPAGLPPTGPDGSPLPPEGTLIPSEAVPTSVVVGADGAIYVGELRGFPATPGTAQVWRIEMASEGMVCDPDDPYSGECTRARDGLTSVVDLAIGRGDQLYALSLSQLGWLAMELGVPGSEIGALTTWIRTPHGNVRTELVPGQLVTPGGVDTSYGGVYVTGPVFGPGSLSTISPGRRHHHR